MPGDDDDFRVGQFLFALAQDLQPVDFVHFHVGDDDVEIVFAFDQRDAPLPGIGDRAVAADALEALGDGLRVGLVVVDDQHADRDARKVGRIALGRSGVAASIFADSMEAKSIFFASMAWAAS